MTTMTSPTHTDLRSLGSNKYVEGVYSIYNPQMGATRNGKPYLKCLLRDASGEVAARKWTFDERQFPELESTGFVWVAGHSQLYNGQVQLIIEQMKSVELSDEEMSLLLPTSSRDPEEMFAELRAILATLEHPAMKGLVETYFADVELMARFRRAPAAVSIHHAWIGGLLEHTLQLVKLADHMLPLYPDLNRDIVMVGLFLHDLGKTAELAWGQGFNYTVDGNLIGHVVRGVIWLQVKAALAAKTSGQRLPPEALRVLQHIVISHHGEPEFGAAKVPATPEAIFVAMLDNLDAKTQMSITAAARDSADQTPFTEKVWALGTRIYRPDPLAAPALTQVRRAGDDGGAEGEREQLA